MNIIKPLPHYHIIPLLFIKFSLTLLIVCYRLATQKFRLMAEEKCDFPHTSLPRSCAKSNLILRVGLGDTSPHNPTIVVNETDSQPRRKQGYTGGSHGLTVSNVCSPCESSDDAQKHTLHQPTSSRSSIDSGVCLSRTSSSGSVKRPSGEGPTFTYKPGSALVNKEPVLTEEDQTSYDEDGCSCILGISPGSDIIKVDDTRVSSTTSEVDDLVGKTESLSVSQKAGMSEREGKGSLYTREPRQTPHDSHTTDVSSTTDAESSWTERKERVSISKEAIDNLMIAAKEIFNDVQHQSQSKNLTSDSRTESDGPFRIAVRRHSTADPYIPLTQHSRQSEKTRKRSVQPFFHHLVPNSDEDGGTFLKRRKKSACIMCERKHNNETAESSTSVIIRRATAPLDCQKVRRYSEVLKTYKPSEIPFTEVRLLKMDDLRQYHHNGTYHTLATFVVQS